MNNKELESLTVQFPLVQKLIALEEVTWFNPSATTLAEGLPFVGLTESDVNDAEMRLQRFAPYLCQAFPETQANKGIIESELSAIPAMQKTLEKIISAKSLEKVYQLLRDRSFIGDFLAYQYAIDLNYSPVIDFSEDTFVKAGIGSIRGIKKCFYPLGKSSFEDAIKYTHDNFEKYQQKYGFTEFKNLFGRQPTLIDIQNCFCETDKYLRAKMPELMIDNKRIKQKYKPTKKPIELFLPPKWGLNDKIENRCIQKNTEGLIPF